MTDMIERVARAIIPDAWRTTMKPAGESHVLVLWEHERARARKYARAAIAAMLWPSKAMEDAGYTDIAFAKGKRPGSLSYRPDYIYMAMIGQALGMSEADLIQASKDRDTSLTQTRSDGG